MTSEDINYKKALAETEVLDGTTGFVRTKGGLTGGEASRLALQQNNTVIQLLIDLHRKIDSLRAEFQVFQNKEASTSKETPDISEVLTKLENLSLEGKGKRVEKQKGTFYAYKDPYVILEEVKNQEKQRR